MLEAGVSGETGTRTQVFSDLIFPALECSCCTHPMQTDAEEMRKAPPETCDAYLQK